MVGEALASIAGVATAAHGAADTRSVWAAWNLDPEILVPVALAGFLYVRGLRNWRDRHRRHPPWRTACYFSGLLVMLAVLESPLDHVGDTHFSFHMLQHELLLMVAAPLILLGAPTTPVLRGMPRWLRLGVVRRLVRQPQVRRLYRLSTHPLVAVLALTSMLWAWHLAPGWYDTAVRDAFVHDLQHISYAATGLLFWWNVIDPAPLRARMQYPLRMAYLLIGSTPKHFLAALITFAGEPLYDAYAQVESIFDISLIDDQVIGGVIMWAPSQMMHLVATAVVFFVWASQSERDQRDAAQTRPELAPAPGDGSPGTT